MTTETTSSNDESTPPAAQGQPGFLRRFGRALSRFLIALLKVTLVLAVIFGLVAASWLIVQELQRSFGVVNGRINRYNQQTNELRLELLALSTQLNQNKNQLAVLQGDIGDLDGRLVETNEDFALALDEQGTRFDGLDTQVENLYGTMGDQADALSSANQSVADLQTDLNANSAELDTLDVGLTAVTADIGLLQSELSTLETDLVSLQTAVAQKEAVVAQVEDTLLLFRIWETVARARLHLSDNNLGLAGADINLAQERLAPLIEELGTDEANTDMVEALALVQTRLAFAGEKLLNDPATAVRDLDSAWEALDGVLILYLGEAEALSEGGGE